MHESSNRRLYSQYTALSDATGPATLQYWLQACALIFALAGLFSLAGCTSLHSSLPIAQNDVSSAATPIIEKSVEYATADNSSYPSTHSSAHSSTQSSHYWHERLVPMFFHARKLVEEHTGQNLRSVNLRITNNADITKEVTHETKKLINNQFDNSRFAEHFLNQVMGGQAGTYAALYATRKSEVMISEPLLASYQAALPDDKQTQDAAILALLIHELVHAADDKKYGIHENRKLNFRASFAQSAAFEGHAQWVTRNICAKENCSSGLESLDHFMFGTNSPPNMLTQPVQAISRNVLEYSYVEGERFVTDIANRPNGDALLQRLLSNPPEDPIQILDPASFPNTDREQRNQRLLAASTQMDHPWLNAPWASVETSPLKGVNLRADPARRDAAVDGFTRLITAMVAVQLYDQSNPNNSPIEVTLIDAESAGTAELFAQTLHENTQLAQDSLQADSYNTKVNAEPSLPTANIFITKKPADNDQLYFTTVGVSDRYVVQLSGFAKTQALFLDYTNKVLTTLTQTQTSRPTDVL